MATKQQTPQSTLPVQFDKEHRDAMALSLIRTLTPVAVGQVLKWAAVIGILETQGEISGALMTLFDFLFTGLYYLIARWLELRVSAKFGWLLGYAQAPSYAPAKKSTGKVS